jgi:acyl carrier protein
MSATEIDVRDSVKAFILEEFLPGEDPAALDDATRLITTGILDSIATVRLVAFLEERYGIELEAHEMSADRLDTLPEIARTVLAKLQRR